MWVKYTVPDSWFFSGPSLSRIFLSTRLRILTNDGLIDMIRRQDVPVNVRHVKSIFRGSKSLKTGTEIKTKTSVKADYT